MKKIAIIGYTGFIGSTVMSYFHSTGMEIVKVDYRAITPKALKGVDVVMNFCGIPITGRYRKSREWLIHDSRAGVVSRITHAISQMSTPPSLFITISAVGIYSSHGVHNEHEHTLGDDKLSHLCRGWESATRDIIPQTRLVILRLGVVLSDRGGAYPRMCQGHSYGVRVILGSGRQWFSWVAMVDLLRIIELAMENDQIHGVINATAPNALSMGEVQKHFSSPHRIWLTLRVPRFVLRWFVGPLGATMICDSKRVHSARLSELGYQFSTPTIERFVKPLN